MNHAAEYLIHPIGITFILIVVVAGFWRWCIHHESSIRRGWHTICNHRRIRALQKRFAPQLAFLKNRLTTGGYLGLHLTVGNLVIILACWWFGGIAEDLIEKDPLIRIDQQLSQWLHEGATPGLTSAARWLTFLGSSEFLTPASLVIAAWLGWRKSWHRLLTWTLVMGGGILLNLALKALFHRPRPVFENSFVTLSDYSFPSGHTMGATLFYGTLALFVILHARRWRWRVLAPLVAFLMILLVAMTRIYLGAHFLSDVLAAMAAGAAWVAVCATAMETIRVAKGQKSSIPK